MDIAIYNVLLSKFHWCSFPVFFINLDDLVVDEGSEDLEALDVQFSLPFNIYITNTFCCTLDWYSVKKNNYYNLLASYVVS